MISWENWKLNLEKLVLGLQGIDMKQINDNVKLLIKNLNNTDASISEVKYEITSRIAALEDKKLLAPTEFYQEMSEVKKRLDECSKKMDDAQLERQTLADIIVQNQADIKALSLKNYQRNFRIVCLLTTCILALVFAAQVNVQ